MTDVNECERLLRALVVCGGCDETRHAPNDECWWQDYSECAYAQAKGTCSFGCDDEPACMTGCPREGWPLANAVGYLAELDRRTP